MKIKPFLTCTIIACLFIACDPIQQETDHESTVPDHSEFDRLLKKHVNEIGRVDYTGFAEDRRELDSYLNRLSSNPPSKRWEETDQIAYWINAYNAFTIELILEHYPLESIRDIGSSVQIPFINSPWDIKFIKIGDQELDLNDIEHSILRERFNEPRIHFAINCASNSCPVLRREAYTGKMLIEQLEEQTVQFINDPSKNLLGSSYIRISRIFNWFRSDFKEAGTVIDFVNRYSEVEIKPNAKIRYLDYDWGLNEL